MSYDYELTLVKEVYDENDTNDIGDAIPASPERAVLCDVLSVTRSEHYSAAAHGLKPEIIFELNKYEYEGEKEVIFEGKKYEVMRAYEPKKSKGIGDFEKIELICSGMVNEA